MISVVDDDPDISKLFYEVLRENIKDLDVFSFNDPISALKHFVENESNYALIICDLRMPGLNGLELLKKVKDKNSSVRTILTSGYNFDEDKLFQDYMEKGIINSNIEKPVTIQRLCQRVSEEIEIYQLQNSWNGFKILQKVSAIVNAPNNLVAPLFLAGPLLTGYLNIKEY